MKEKDVEKEEYSSSKELLFEDRDAGINSARWEKNGFRNYSISHYNARFRSWSNLRIDADPKQVDACIDALDAVKDDLLSFKKEGD